jgi:alpha-glucosidase
MAFAVDTRNEDFDDSAKTPYDWRRGVTYQLYPRSFADGNGDGVGDLAGAIAKIPYIASLGVDAVWVSPWFVSPMADGGYDVADYCDIDPLFGTLDDAQRFIDECHAAGLKVLIDIVANHCSSAHPWFLDALASAPGSTARERFYFRDGRGVDGEEPPTDWVSVFGGPAWTRVVEADGRPGQWYLHLFDPSQPDLNWNNPTVVSDFDDIFAFWFARGIDGFRLDAVPAIGKDADFRDAGCDPNEQFAPETSAPTTYWDAGHVHDVVRHWRRVAESYDPPKYLVGEINVSSVEALLRYIRADEMQSVFAFNLTKSPWTAGEFRTRIEGHLNFDSQGATWPTWILSSHDEVRSATRLAEGGTPAVGRARARAALLLTLALPGAACVYQGEELGLPQVIDLPVELLEDPIVARTGKPERGRDGCRVGLPWTTEMPGYGFSATSPRLPQPTSWATYAVSEQEREESSFLHFTRTAIAARRKFINGTTDDVRWIDLGSDVVAFERGDIRCVMNFSDHPIEIDDATVLLSSGDVTRGHVARDTTVWLNRSVH